MNEEVILRYLLGELPEPEAIEVEDRAFSEPAVMQQVLAVESDLIDEYVRGGLSSRQRSQFETRFLASHERRQKVEFATALARVVPATGVATESRRSVAASSSWTDLLRLIRGARPAFRFAMGVAGLALIIGLGWLITQTIRQRAEIGRLQAEQKQRNEQQNSIEQQLSEERQRRENLASELQREREQRERSEELAHQLEDERNRLAEAQKEGVAPSAGTILSLILLPGLSRGAGDLPKVDIGKPARLVRLQLGLERGDDYKSFGVEIRTARGQEVWNQRNLRARQSRGSRQLNVVVPANLLQDGEYEVALKGTNDQQTEDVRYYYFDVAKQK
ncbi:MAG TPA: hypothetical protein VG778_06040 [Blastocatellia bacterium]|nr:hypothetical protein [Blastocatellia bacterium]